MLRSGPNALCTRAVAAMLCCIAALLCSAATPAGASSADARRYELVSPVVKGGGDVMVVTSRTRAAASGDAAAFSSLAGFGDVRGSGLSTEYLSRRDGVPGTSGWTTHGITPRQPPLTIIGAFQGLDSNYAMMTPDLSAGVYRSFRPLSDTPDVSDIQNLYVRDDLLSPGDGNFQIATDPGSPVQGLLFTPPPAVPMVAGISANASHIAFESSLNLAPGAAGGEVKLYEWAGGAPRLVGILPDGTPAPSSQAGEGAALPARHNVSHPVSDDGSRIFFQAPAGQEGNIYVRIDGTTSVQLNASERSVPDTPQGASLRAVTPDGMHAFFVTGEQLVDGDTDGSTDLYEYDATRPLGHRLTLISRAGEPSDIHSVRDVIGVSDDGDFVYFISAGQLVAGEPLLGANRGIYVWHDGTIRFIGSFGNPTDSDLNALGSTWTFVNSTSNGRVTPDGRHLMFMTTTDIGLRGRGGFSGYDQGSTCTTDAAASPCRELYVYGADTGQLRCASCNARSATATADALTAVVVGGSNSFASSHVSHALSDDGRWAFFTTGEALVPEDTNGRLDAYAYDAETGTPHLLSSGRSTYDSYFLDAGASGRDAFFATRERLVGWDVDDNYDLYDARVGGGFPEPPVAPPSCPGDACQGAPPAPPAIVQGASSGFHGRGNVAGHLRARHARRCRHGTRRRLVRRGKQRCVKRRRARKTGSNGRVVRGESK